MFWKKKNKTPELISLDDNERRRDVRIQPQASLFLSIDELQLPIQDISASGLSFLSQSHKLPQDISVIINLSDDIAIECSLKILKCINEVCHCQFSNISADAQRELDQFILNEQKLQIRRHIRQQKS